MPILKVKDVIERFQYSFDEDFIKNSSPDLTKRISKFSTNLKKIVNNLGNLAKQSLKLAESYEIFAKKLPKFGEILLHYEKTCLTEYTNHHP